MVLKSQTFDFTMLRFDPERRILSCPEGGEASSGIEWVKIKGEGQCLPLLLLIFRGLN